MLHKFLVFLFTVLLAPYLSGQTFTTIKSFGSWHFQEQGNDIAVDKCNNVYSIGFISTDCFYDGIQIKSLYTAGYTMVLIKHDLAGNTIWIKTAGANGANTTGEAIAIDDSCNVYIAVKWTSNTGISPEFEGVKLTTGNGIFLAKLNSNGDLKWIKEINLRSNYGYAPVDLCLGHNNDLYLVGSYSGNAIFPDSVNIPPANTGGSNCDIFVSRFDRDGVAKWAKKFGGAQQNYASDVVADSLGNIYCTGAVSYNANFDSVSISRSSREVMFLLKADTSGKVKWVQADTLESCPGFRVAMDLKGNIVVTGGRNAFFCKYDSTGTRLWNIISSAFSAYGTFGSGICIDPQNNYYFTGAHYDNITIGSLTYPSGDFWDIFVVKISEAGKPKLLRRLMYTYAEHANAMALGSNGKLYITGDYSETSATASSDYLFTIFDTGSTVGVEEEVIPNHNNEISIGIDSNKQLHVLYKNSPSNGEIQIFDLCGNRIATQKNTEAQFYIFDMQHVSSGVYFCRSITYDGVVTQKIVIH